MFKETGTPNIEMKAKENEINEEFVKKSFKELAPDFDIDKHPDLVDKLLKTQEHFKDAKRIAEILRDFCDSQEDKDEAGLIGLLHDIGKSGPPDDPEAAEVIQQVFASKKFKTSRFAPVAKFLKNETEFFPNPEKMIKILEEKLNIDTNNLSMIELFRLHAKWTWDILSPEDSGVDRRIATIVASHHLLEDKNPAKLDFEHNTAGEIPGLDKMALLEITDKFIMLTLVDKYQAFLDRGHTPHDVAIKTMGEMIEKANLPEEIKVIYRAALQKLNAKMGAIETETPQEIEQAA